MSSTLKIDRTSAFNPVAFIGNGWSIVEEDEHSLALSEIDLSKINFETMLKDGERAVAGEERLRRLKGAGCFRLDAKVFHALWENKHLIPASWKDLTDGFPTYVFFDGTILQGPDSFRCVLYLCWENGRWFWNCYKLVYPLSPSDPSAVLTS